MLGHSLFSLIGWAGETVCRRNQKAETDRGPTERIIAEISLWQGMKEAKILNNEMKVYNSLLLIWSVADGLLKYGGFVKSMEGKAVYRPSATVQMCVLFRRGPWIMYAVTKRGKKSKQASYIYGRVLRAKMWRYDLCGRRHRLHYENQGRNDVMPLLKLTKKSTLVRC